MALERSGTLPNQVGIMELSFKNLQIRNLVWLVVSLGVLWVDQVSKHWALNALSGIDGLTVIPGFFDLSLGYNYGAAFSFLNDDTAWHWYFFVGIAFSLSSVLLVWLCNIPQGKRVLLFSISLILGGAFGNLYDRFSHGYVIDFIAVYYRDWHWPTFNIADSAICVGAALLILATWQEDRKKLKGA